MGSQLASVQGRLAVSRSFVFVPQDWGFAMHEIELWVVVDNEGDYAVGNDEDSAHETYNDSIGGVTTRTIKLRLNVALPTVVELVGTVPATGQAAELTVIQ